MTQLIKKTNNIGVNIQIILVIANNISKMLSFY